MKKLPTYKFQLYAAEHTPNSSLAVANLLEICKNHLKDRYEVEIIDVFTQPNRAMQLGIRMTPTLVKIAPHPRRTIVGTLSQTERVLAALGIDPRGGD